MPRVNSCHMTPNFLSGKVATSMFWPQTPKVKKVILGTKFKRCVQHHELRTTDCYFLGCFVRSNRSKPCAIPSITFLHSDGDSRKDVQTLRHISERMSHDIMKEAGVCLHLKREFSLPIHRYRGNRKSRREGCFRNGGRGQEGNWKGKWSDGGTWEGVKKPTGEVRKLRIFIPEIAWNKCQAAI